MLRILVVAILGFAALLPLGCYDSSECSPVPPDRALSMEQCVNLPPHELDPNACDGFATGNFDDIGWRDLATIQTAAKMLRVWRLASTNPPGGVTKALQAITLDQEPVAIVADRFTQGQSRDHIIVVCRNPTTNSHNVYLLLADPAGTFGVPTRIASLPKTPVCAATFGRPRDGSGTRHLAVACTGEMVFLRNDSAGGRLWTSTTLPLAPGDAAAQPTGVGAGDLDNDKDVEIAEDVVTTFVSGAGAAFLVAFSDIPNAQPADWAFRELQSFALTQGTPRSLVVSNLSGLDILGGYAGDPFAEVATMDEPSGRVCVYRNKMNDAAGVWLKLDKNPEEILLSSGAPLSIAGGGLRCAGDGKDDLTLHHSPAARMFHLLENASGADPIFIDQGSLSAGASTSAPGLVAVDMNGDARPDLVTSDRVWISK